jgi:hypothetical protein
MRQREHRRASIYKFMFGAFGPISRKKSSFLRSAPSLSTSVSRIIEDKDPEPSGLEGLADVRIIRALNRSARIGEPVKLGDFEKSARPGPEQEIRRRIMIGLAGTLERPAAPSDTFILSRLVLLADVDHSRLSITA